MRKTAMLVTAIWGWAGCDGGEPAAEPEATAEIRRAAETLDCTSEALSTTPTRDGQSIAAPPLLGPGQFSYATSSSGWDVYAPHPYDIYGKDNACTDRYITEVYGTWNLKNLLATATYWRKAPLNAAECGRLRVAADTWVVTQNPTGMDWAPLSNGAVRLQGSWTGSGCALERRSTHTASLFDTGPLNTRVRVAGRAFLVATTTDSHQVVGVTTGLARLGQ